MMVYLGNDGLYCENVQNTPKSAWINNNKFLTKQKKNNGLAWQLPERSNSYFFLVVWLSTKN